MVRAAPDTLAPGGGASADKAGWTWGTVSRTVWRMLCACAPQTHNAGSSTLTDQHLATCFIPYFHSRCRISLLIRSLEVLNNMQGIAFL
jgi:hypothetical protein